MSNEQNQVNLNKTDNSPTTQPTQIQNTSTNSNAPLTLNHTQQVNLTDKTVLNHTQIVSQTQPQTLNHTKQAEQANALVKNKEIAKIKRQVLTKKVTENISPLKNLLLLDLLLAFLTTFFFGLTNTAYIGFPIYTIIVSCLLYSYLNKNNLVTNKAGFKWLVPINLIAFSNAIFYTNAHALNIFVVHILFGLMLTKTTNSKFSEVYDFSLLLRILSNFAPKFAFTGVLLDKILVNNETTKAEKSKSNFTSILLGVVVAIPVLFVVLILLGEADANFRVLVDSIFDFQKYLNNFGYKLFYFGFAFVIFMFYSTKIFYTKEFEPKVIKKLKLNTVTVSTFLVLLNVVYILFLCLQAQYVFTDGLFVLPSDFTYSEYARDGFFPTFNVTIINLCLITFILHFTTIDFSDKVFKINFGIMFTANILLIFNALNRMYLYIATYGYTTLRTLPTLGLILVLILMILLGLYITKKINFYKYALISFVVFFVVQAYTCNDVVSTHLNFKKFDITIEDFDSIDFTNYDTKNFTITTSDGHVVDFERNLDTYWYLAQYDPTIIHNTPTSEYFARPIEVYLGRYAYYNIEDDNYLEIYNDVPFYSKSFLQIALENIKYNNTKYI